MLLKKAQSNVKSKRYHLQPSKIYLQNQTTVKQSKSATAKPKPNQTRTNQNKNPNKTTILQLALYQKMEDFNTLAIKTEKKQKSLHFYHIFIFIQHGTCSTQSYETCKEDRFKFEGKKYKSPYSQMTQITETIV